MSLKLKIAPPGPPKLKLNFPAPSPGASTTPATPATPAPASAVTPGPKISLKVRTASQPSTPAPEDVPLPKKTKAGRVSKPTPKLNDSKKRVRENSDSGDENSTIAVVPRQPLPKKLKINTGGTKTKATKSSFPNGVTPVFKVVGVGKPPKRPLGVGYDSEASDNEIDPLIEEEFILRMLPGDDCEYLRTAIAQKQIGSVKDISMKFFHAEGRRAAITIRGHIYAATLVDLPCIIEGMKSWDKRGWWKAADICQMLWVFASIKSEEAAKTIDLPKDVDPVTFQYPHGITPPMHFARKRRFRKRISRTTIEAVEEQVERLLAEDKTAISTKIEILDPDSSRQGSRAVTAPESEGDEYSEDEDAEGDEEPGYFDRAPPVADDPSVVAAEVEDELHAAFEQQLAKSAANTPSSAPVFTPSMVNGGDTPLADVGDTPMADDEEGEEEGTEEGEEDSGDEEDDEAVLLTDEQAARQREVAELKEVIAGLEYDLEKKREDYTNQPNAILKKRIEQQIISIKVELNLKKSSLPADSMED
jgi:transcription initiation factor TFIID subunit 7